VKLASLLVAEHCRDGELDGAAYLMGAKVS